MTFFELFLVALALSMDAFAISVGKGFQMKQVGAKAMVTAGLYFGGFQALMPLAGYFLSVRFADYITAWDHWIAFLLLAFIGVRMLLGGSDGQPDPAVGSGDTMSAKAMLPLALATSIDALAVGISFALLRVQIVPASMFIGCVTFALSAVGVKIGQISAGRLRSGAERAGGIILVLMGLKILLEHTGLIG